MKSETLQELCSICGKPLVEGEHSACDAEPEVKEGKSLSEQAAKIVEYKNPFGIIRRLHEIDPALHKEIALRLIEAGNGLFVASNLHEFKDLDYKEFLLRLIEAGEASTVVSHYRDYKKELDREVALKLIEVGEGGALINQRPEIKDLDYNDIAIKFLELGEGNVVVDYLYIFKNLDSEVALKLIETGKGEAVADHLSRFKDLDREVAFKLIEIGRSEVVVTNLFIFKDLDHKEIALKIIETGEGYQVADNIREFKGADQAVALKLIEAGMGVRVAHHLSSYKDLEDREIAIKLIEAGEAAAVAVNIENFDNLNAKDYQTLIDKLISEGDIVRAIYVNSISPHPDMLLKKADDLFGEYLTLEIFNVIRDLDRGVVSPEAEQLGVRRGGFEGGNDLRGALREIQNQIIRGEPDLELIFENDLARATAKATVRFTFSDWGEHEDSEFLETVNYYNENKEGFRKLPEEYIPSGPVEVKLVDAKRQEQFKHTEAFLSRYGELITSVKEARRIVDDEQVLNEVLNRLRTKREQILSKFSSQIEEQKNPKAKENIERQRKSLESVDFANIEHPQEAFTVLTSLKGQFDKELRELVFYAAFRFNQEQQMTNLDEFDPEKPTLDQLSWTINFIDHITNQETMAKYFTDKEAAKRFKGLLNVSALEQEITRWQNQSGTKKTTMEFVPNRNLTTEFSGHFSDACWASKYKSILDKLPNFIGFTIVQNPEDPKHESIAGGAFLIETVSEDDEPLLVIRGLNPRENVINRLVVRDFFDKITAYVKALAKKTGRKAAIVIDDHSGGAATNRPVLYNYLAGFSGGLKKVRLKSNKDTEFNGYDIRSDCYLL